MHRLIDADELRSMVEMCVSCDSGPVDFIEEIDEAPTVLTIPDNPTNGDMIKAMFPNGKEINTEDGDLGYEIFIEEGYSFCSWFDGLWWNAPYKENTDES